jgi:hypothetical protein
MMRRESLPIAQPCDADWEQMDGDESVRFCHRCAKHVHNLSAMSEADARALVATSERCIRYTHDAGRVRFAGRSGPLPRLAAAAALAFGSLASSACMGKLVCPVPPPDQPAPAGAPASEQPAPSAAPSDDPQPAPPQPE